VKLGTGLGTGTGAGHFIGHFKVACWARSVPCWALALWHWALQSGILGTFGTVLGTGTIGTGHFKVDIGHVRYRVEHFRWCVGHSQWRVGHFLRRTVAVYKITLIPTIIVKLPISRIPTSVPFKNSPQPSETAPSVQVKRIIYLPNRYRTHANIDVGSLGTPPLNILTWSLTPYLAPFYPPMRPLLLRRKMVAPNGINDIRDDGFLSFPSRHDLTYYTLYTQLKSAIKGRKVFGRLWNQKWRVFE